MSTRTQRRRERVQQLDELTEPAHICIACKSRPIDEEGQTACAQCRARGDLDGAEDTITEKQSQVKWLEDQLFRTQAELDQARADKRELVREIDAQGLFPRTELAHELGMSRSQLYLWLEGRTAK